MSSNFPRLVIAGTGGDAGKTLVSLALLTAWRRQGLPVAAFKKGPDYIDRGWLAWASRAEARNLDAYLMAPEVILGSFAEAAQGARVSVVEGNRGLHDGLDAQGTFSTAELAKLLRAPVVLILDATKVTRTAAAVALGCQRLDPLCPVAGVILNRVAGARHEAVVRQAVEAVTGLPVVGVIPRQPALAELLPDRHLGLVTPEEHGGPATLEEALVRLAQDALDLEGLLRLADSAPALPAGQLGALTAEPCAAPAVRIGFFTDPAFTFYYPENLAALRRQGAELVPISACADPDLPALDALYLGGGFPETQAAALSGNVDLRRAVLQAAHAGLPIYAECGGLMYLSQSLKWQGETYPMAGVFPLEIAVEKGPQGHGYMEIDVDGQNPVFEAGARLRGHEFHYSRILSEPNDIKTVFNVRRGTGVGQGRDGLLAGNTLACYVHLHSLATPEWAPGLVAAALRYRGSKRGAQPK